MWWDDIARIGARLKARRFAAHERIDPSATIEPGALLDEREGPVVVGAGTRICAGATVRGPVAIGAGCLIGNQAFLRGPAILGDRVSIGFSTEIKHALIGDGVSIGPMCFVADSRIDDGAYLGAMVRTSNHRLDGKPVSVREGTATVETGFEKLGCWIGEGAALGIQVIVLPGRVVAPGSTFEPRITIDRNYPRGHYRVAQQIEAVGSFERTGHLS